MSVDRQRIEAVQRLEIMGWTWTGAEWVTPVRTMLDGALLARHKRLVKDLNMWLMSSGGMNLAAYDRILIEIADLARDG